MSNWSLGGSRKCKQSFELTSSRNGNKREEYPPWIHQRSIICVSQRRSILLYSHRRREDVHWVACCQGSFQSCHGCRCNRHSGFRNHRAEHSARLFSTSVYILGRSFWVADMFMQGPWGQSAGCYGSKRHGWKTCKEVHWVWSMKERLIKKYSAPKRL